MLKKNLTKNKKVVTKMYPNAVRNEKEILIG